MDQVVQSVGRITVHLAPRMARAAVSSASSFLARLVLPSDFLWTTLTWEPFSSITTVLPSAACPNVKVRIAENPSGVTATAGTDRKIVRPRI